MFRDQLRQDAARIQDQFDLVLAAYDDLPVTHAMGYATRGGKRLRGFLVLETARLFEVDTTRAIWPATAIEALHAYSLVHDDLPCMDDDDLRRGQPTVHVKWDEATAVLAGDALQTLAFDLVARVAVGTAETRISLVQSLSEASGANGMVLGQALDMAAEAAPAPLDLDQITRLQAGKTGALIEWSASVGAVLAEADPAPLRQYARALGLAFQIADDILDVEGDAEKAGKRLNKDDAAGKATFVSLLGLDQARSRAAELIEQANAALEPFGSRTETLKQAARFVIARDS
ncbi:polyprenyl synthetase family protein [Ruegeria sp. 2012CJ41-6]|uniref:Polyprenyl synthetase family protein n=1 Tax=Ruegeria spongiae TaxID=2942209 RepID=A0ABT0Q6U3_9RHOB|nr:farnesyl diphosphate synthase [Ruegeria spongiae]MCL6284878.1 polyprenyl synthetase family protein [Ruegeria spongiae]